MHNYKHKYETVQTKTNDLEEIKKPINNCIEDGENYHATFTSKKLDLEKRDNK